MILPTVSYRKSHRSLHHLSRNSQSNAKYAHVQIALELSDMRLLCLKKAAAAPSLTIDGRVIFYDHNTSVVIEKYLNKTK